jgi:hypothetical protein
MPNRTGKFIIKYTATLKWVTLCLVTVLISNCMATGPKYPDIFLQDTSKAMVVIYRPPPPITVPVEYIEWPPSIYHGGEKLIELKPNAYTYVEVEPGLTTFTARIKVSGEIQGTVNINTKSGLYYYLRYVPFRYKGLFPADPYEFKVVPTGFAREELIDARYQLLLK